MFTSNNYNYLLHEEVPKIKVYKTYKTKIHPSSNFKQLSVFHDEDVLCALCKVESLTCKNAKILQHNHYITCLLVRNYNEVSISGIKIKFYISKLLVVYKNVRTKCQRCKSPGRTIIAYGFFTKSKARQIWMPIYLCRHRLFGPFLWQQDEKFYLPA